MDFTNVRNLVIESFKKNYKTLIAMSFCLFVIIGLCLTLNLFVSGTIVITCACVILPFFVSMVICNLKMKQLGTFENKDFYSNFKVGFMIVMNGTFRYFRSLIYSVVCFLIFFILIFVCPVQMGIVNADEMINLANNMMTNNTNEAYLALQEFLSTPSNDGVTYLYISILISYAASIMLFVFCMIKNMLIFFIQTNFGCNKGDAIRIYKKAFTNIRSMYFKVNFSVLWSFYILFPAGYAAGSFLSTIWTTNLNIISFTGACGALLFCVPLLPIAVCSQDVLFSVCSPYFLVEARPMLLESLRNLNNNPAIGEEEKEIVRKFYVDQLKQIDAISKTVNDVMNSENIFTFDVDSLNDLKNTSVPNYNEDEEEKNEKTNEDLETKDNESNDEDKK